MDDPAKAVFGFRGRAGRVPYALAFVAAAGVGLCFPDEITPAGIRASQGTTLIGLIGVGALGLEVDDPGKRRRWSQHEVGCDRHQLGRLDDDERARGW